MNGSRLSQWTRIAIATASIGAVFACSSSSSSGEGNGGAPAASSSVNDYCVSDCANSCACAGSFRSPGCPSGGGPDPACVSKCVNATYQVAATRMRDDWFRNRTACLRGLACDGGDCCDSVSNSCEEKYSLADPAFPNIPVVQKCHGLVSQRSTDEGNCRDAATDCDRLAELTDAARQNADTACLGGGKSCSDLMDCIDQALGF